MTSSQTDGTADGTEDRLFVAPAADGASNSAENLDPPPAAAPPGGERLAILQDLSESVAALRDRVERMSDRGHSPVQQTHRVEDGDADPGSGQDAADANALNDRVASLEFGLAEFQRESRLAIKRSLRREGDSGPAPKLEKWRIFNRLLCAMGRERAQGFPDPDYVPSVERYEALAAGDEEHALAVKAFLTDSGQQIPDGKATMIVSDPQTGGYLAPPEFVAGMIPLLQEMSPVRAICRTITTGAQSVFMDRLIAHPSAVWTGELTQRQDQDLDPFGQVEISVHEQDARVAVSRRNLMNARIDLGGWLQGEFAMQLGRAEGYAFVNGDGVARPRGFITDTGTQSYTTSTAGTLADDDLVRASFVLLSEYMMNATWVLKRQTVRDIRLMKDGQGRYHWAPGLSGSLRAATILGMPYVESDAMPTVASGNVALMLGDFRRGYTIVDRAGIFYLVDPYSLSQTGRVRYSGYRYVGGDVIDPNALLRVIIAS